MKRTINFTGRLSIFHDDARISLFEASGSDATFEAQLDLAEYGLPGHAEIFIEAYRQTTWMRFAWGTVANMQPCSDRRLREFRSTDEIHFRVKVIDPARQGQLLAEADQIHPRDPDDQEADRVPLLPVKPEDLGEEPWRVEFDSPATRLLVNSAFGDVHAIALSPAFRTLVYPAVLRIVLHRILCDREPDGTLPGPVEADEWQSRWILFCTRLPGVDAAADPFEADDLEVRMRWIDDVARAFCRRHRLRDAFASVHSGGASS